MPFELFGRTFFADPMLADCVMNEEKAQELIDQIAVTADTRQLRFRDGIEREQLSGVLQITSVGKNHYAIGIRLAQNFTPYLLEGNFSKQELSDKLAEVQAMTGMPLHPLQKKNY